jgi:pimeloyl-ACP methyl ester carboxylesterase
MPASNISTARSWHRAALIWLALLITCYCAAMAFLWHTQESRLFLPRTVDEARAASVIKQLPHAQQVWLLARDGTRLHGWFRPATPGAPSGRVLLYFGGNAEDVHWRLARVERFAGWDILLTDYRGYGLSAGAPSQAAMQEDALLWHDRLVAGLDGLPAAETVVVMGTSLGSYFATHVAAQRPVKGAVLVTPFDSVRDYVQTRMPIVPVGLLLRHPLDSRAWAPAVKAPSLFIDAAQDTTIPPVSAQPLYWEALTRFLRGL